MANRWMLRRGGRDHGPFSTDQIRSMAADGRLKATDQLQKNGQGAFCPMATFSVDLQSRAGVPATPPTIPQSPIAPRSSPNVPRRPGNSPPSLPLPGAPASRPTGRPLPAVGMAPAPGMSGASDGTVTTAGSDLILWLTLGTIAAMVVSIILSPWCTWHEDGLDYPVAMLLSLVTDMVAIVLELILLYICWERLPEHYRFQGIAPWLAIVLLFIPVVGFAGYFVAYGMLASGWQRYESDRGVRDASEKTGVAFWGWACAVTLTVMWVLADVTFLAGVLESSSMEWYESVVAPNVRVPRARGGRGAGAVIAIVLRFFSVRDIARMWLAFCTFAFFAGIHGLINPTKKPDPST